VLACTASRRSDLPLRADRRKSHSCPFSYNYALPGQWGAAPPPSRPAVAGMLLSILLSGDPGCLLCDSGGRGFSHSFVPPKRRGPARHDLLGGHN
jgi:hypothetical protein